MSQGRRTECPHCKTKLIRSEVPANPLHGFLRSADVVICPVCDLVKAWPRRR